MNIMCPRSLRRFARAFTLTELLVILAILGILSAILFPVFHAHRFASQQVICAANEEQLGRATRLYTQDYDDKYPMAFGYDAARGWLTSIIGSVPYNWQCADGICGPNTTASQQGYWANSIAPYVGNYNVYNCPSTVTSALFQGTRGSGNAPPPAKVSYTYNGLLMSYPAASVKFPAEVPLFSEGNGKGNLEGFAFSNPQLICPDRAKPCVYIPRTTRCVSGNGGKSGNYAFLGSAWVHGKGANFLMSDGHIHWLRLGIGAGSGNDTTDYSTDPGAYYDANGFPGPYWRDGCYQVVFFSPDFDHSNP